MWQLGKGLKFKVWDEDDKKMQICEGLDSIIQYELLAQSAGKQVSHQVFLQYTGIQDRLGNEIFEGDLVQVRHAEDVQVIRLVAWFRAKAGWWFYRTDKNFDVMLKVDLSNKLELKGNIFENPELFV